MMLVSPSNVYLAAGRRLAVKSSRWVGEDEDWYVAYSPRNDSACAEGTWEEWVNLAKLILAKDEERKAEDAG